MEISITIAGFGGQGVLFAGQILAYAGMDHGLEVTWIPSYGPEMRGGTANCTVIISDEPIGAPTVAHPDVALVLNEPSLQKYEPLLKSGGLLIINSSLVTTRPTRTDIDIGHVPANDIANSHGSDKMMNMAVLGALLARRKILPLEAVTHSLAAHLPESKSHLLEANLEVLKQGYEAIEATPV